MRKGVNPSKLIREENTKFIHRVIIPVYIPQNKDLYYKNLPEILKTALIQLFRTIDPQITAVTIINNDSSVEVQNIINEFHNRIDKTVSYNVNKGKVNALLAEVRGCFEPFVTLADADVLFLEGWEDAVFDIFNSFVNAGVVAPLPSPGLAFNHNNSLFFKEYFSGDLRYESVVDKKDSKLYISGLGNESILNRNNRRYHWYEKQYVLKKKNTEAIVGAGHFVATYKTAIFKNEKSFPKLKFKNGYEDKFIDQLADKKGLYRLSTVKTFAYHIGTDLDKTVDYLIQQEGKKVSLKIFYKIFFELKTDFVPYFFKKLFFRALKKIRRL